MTVDLLLRITMACCHFRDLCSSIGATRCLAGGTGVASHLFLEHNRHAAQFSDDLITGEPGFAGVLGKVVQFQAGVEVELPVFPADGRQRALAAMVSPDAGKRLPQ